MIAARALAGSTLARLLALVVCWGASICPAHAGALSVMPVRVEVPADRRFCALTVGNGSDRPVTVQVRGFGWSRDEGGADILDPDPGFVVNPPMATIAPGANRLIRCSLPAPSPGQPERQWRLIVDELPDPALERPGVVQTLLRLSVPVFRGDAAAAPRLSASLDDKGLRIVNTGTGYARVVAVTLKGRDRTETLGTGFYLLAGGAQIVPAAQLPPGLSQVRVRTEEGEFDLTLATP